MIRCRCTRAQVHQRAPRSNSATAPKALPASMQKAEASTWKQRAKHSPNLGKAQTQQKRFHGTSRSEVIGLIFANLALLAHSLRNYVLPAKTVSEPPGFRMLEAPDQGKASNILQARAYRMLMATCTPSEEYLRVHNVRRVSVDQDCRRRSIDGPQTATRTAAVRLSHGAVPFLIALPAPQACSKPYQPIGSGCGFTQPQGAVACRPKPASEREVPLAHKARTAEVH